MIVHILPPSATFKAVSYNTNKIGRDKGELMKVSGFGALQGLSNLRPEDYKLYLQSVSALNKRVHFPQFHAVISAKGKAHDKLALTEIATQWLNAMGYGDQPYLLVYHKDTANNHIHIVSTRIGRDGKKINSGFEHIRAVNSLNRIMGIDEGHSAKQEVANALNYSFVTKAQFMMILESRGYSLKTGADTLEVMKFGKVQESVSLSLIEEKIKANEIPSARKAQLKAIFHKYAGLYDTSLQQAAVTLPGGYEQKPSGYTSDFAAALKEKFGLVLLFHAKDGKPPYGYSVIDHAGKAVFKGGELMPLAELLTVRGSAVAVEAQAGSSYVPAGVAERRQYAALLKAALYNYPDFVQGLLHQGLAIVDDGETYRLIDAGAGICADCGDLLNEQQYDHMIRQLGRGQQLHPDGVQVPGVFISPDVDDQAVHGRRRKKKARSHSR